jgi:hypothetical protein
VQCHVMDNGLTLTGRPGTGQIPNHEDRSAGPVQCREPMQSRRRPWKIGGGSLPQEDCMGYATILGLDLRKFKSVCSVMDAAIGLGRRGEPQRHRGPQRPSRTAV